MKKFNRNIFLLLTIISLTSCKKTNSNSTNNSRPLISLQATLLSANPFTFKFIATASDADNDPLKFIWNFGEGTIKEGAAQENFTYPDSNDYTVKATVTDGKTAPVEASISVSTKIVTVTINRNQQYQTIEGFGGFGAQDVPWSSGPFTSAGYITRLLDLGVSIIRDEVPTNFEYTNDNARGFSFLKTQRRQASILLLPVYGARHTG